MLQNKKIYIILDRSMNTREPDLGDEVWLNFF